MLRWNVKWCFSGMQKEEIGLALSGYSSTHPAIGGSQPFSDSDTSRPNGAFVSLTTLAVLSNLWEKDNQLHCQAVNCHGNSFGKKQQSCEPYLFFICVRFSCTFSFFSLCCHKSFTHQSPFSPYFILSKIYSHHTKYIRKIGQCVTVDRINHFARQRSETTILYFFIKTADNMIMITW